MNAKIGDRIIVRGHKVGDHVREGVVLEVHGAGDEPPFLVRWSDGHEGLVFPGTDAVVEHDEPAQPSN